MVYVLFVPGANPNSAVENVIVQQSFCKMFKRGKLAWHRHDGNLNCCISCTMTALYLCLWVLQCMLENCSKSLLLLYVKFGSTQAPDSLLYCPITSCEVPTSFEGANW